MQNLHLKPCIHLTRTWLWHNWFLPFLSTSYGSLGNFSTTVPAASAMLEIGSCRLYFFTLGPSLLVSLAPRAALLPLGYLRVARLLSLVNLPRGSGTWAPKFQSRVQKKSIFGVATIFGQNTTGVGQATLSISQKNGEPRPNPSKSPRFLGIFDFCYCDR